ncbi:MAG: methionine--tRNA ligase [candidate division Zixibacteria bacterium]|nr:methionine--tRNA ligase [candidate division Zixibacteria bacterium]
MSRSAPLPSSDPSADSGAPQTPVYITTPIYYVNDKPHIGHAYTTIVADYLTRAHRLLGRPAFFLTGTDEHGARIAQVAREHGIKPQEWCDRHSEHFRAAWKRLDVAYDQFIRTTDKRHVDGVRRMLERMHAATVPDGKPVIYEGIYTGLYCLGCEKFITEKELVDGLCPSHLTAPQKLTEKNYFFRLSAFLPQVERLINENSIRILPEERRREVLGLFKQGLEDFSISREKVDWGIPLPFDPSQNAYVWVDALPNYITAVGYGDDPESFARWWTQGTVIHLMAKDILKFHAVYWPAMLLSIGEAVPDQIFIHGYFTVNGQKMSKSLQNAIDPNLLVDRFGTDGTRYLLLTQFPFGQDGDVKADLFIRQFNADLANDLGNLVSRAVTLIERHFEGRRPPGGASQPIDNEQRQQAESCGKRFAAAIESLAPHDAIGAGIDLVRAANRYLEKTQPWSLAKENDLARLGTVLNTAVESIRVAAIILSPILPSKSRLILATLGFTDPEAELNRQGLSGWDRCPGPFHLEAPIFPRMDKVALPSMEKALMSEPTAVAGENVITVDQFRQTQLCTAEVISAEKIAGADRLLKLQIALGEERRQIVAGIAQHYKPEDLVGRTIVVVANLQPATIRGIASQGMLLAASNGPTLRLITTDGPIDSGSSIG